jgi:hypothetical protein
MQRFQCHEDFNVVLYILTDLNHHWYASPEEVHSIQ